MRMPRFSRKRPPVKTITKERAALRQLQNDAVEAFYGLAQTGLQAHPGWEFTLGFAAGWTRHIIASVDSVRFLHDNGLGLQAAPIRRLLIEHATCVLTVAHDHEAFDSYIRGLQRSTKSMMSGLAKIGLPSSDDMESILEWTTDDSTRRLDTYLHAKHRFEQMGESGDRLHVLWLFETQFSHAGFVTANIYLRDTVNSDYPTLTAEPTVPSNDLAADFLCAESLAMALDGLSIILIGDPLRTIVENLNMRRDALLDSATRE